MDRRDFLGMSAAALCAGLVITHEAALAADADHPYPQIVGGGPAPESATVISGHADNSGLSLIVRDLAGKELWNHSFPD